MEETDDALVPLGFLAAVLVPLQHTSVGDGSKRGV